MLGYRKYLQVEIQNDSEAHLLCFPFFKDPSPALSVVHSLERVVAFFSSFLVVDSKKASLVLVTKSCLEANFQKKK